jgi:hypothetical protein
VSSTKHVLDIFILGQLIHGNKTLDDFVTSLSNVYNCLDNGAIADERLRIGERVALSKKLLDNLKALEEGGVITSSVTSTTTDLNVPGQEKSAKYTCLITVYELTPVSDF